MVAVLACLFISFASPTLISETGMHTHKNGLIPFLVLQRSLSPSGFMIGLSFQAYFTIFSSRNFHTAACTNLHKRTYTHTAHVKTSTHTYIRGFGHRFYRLPEKLAINFYCSSSDFLPKLQFLHIAVSQCYGMYIYHICYHF